jgi:hypothetical protein
MTSRNSTTYALLIAISLCAISLCGCKGWVPRDTKSLLFPKFQRSEIVGLVAGFGTTFAAPARFSHYAQTAFKQGYEPEDGGYHGTISNYLDLLRALDRFAAGSAVEHHRRGYQFSERWSVFSFRALRDESRMKVMSYD